LSALERLAQGELSTVRRSRARRHHRFCSTVLAHDAMRIWPDLDVSLMPVAGCDHRRIARWIAAGRGQRGSPMRSNTEGQLASTVGSQLTRGGWRSPSTTTAVAFPRERAQGWCSSGSPAVSTASPVGVGTRPGARCAASRIARLATASLEASPLGGVRLLLRPAGPDATRFRSSPRLLPTGYFLPLCHDPNPATCLDVQVVDQG